MDFPGSSGLPRWHSGKESACNAKDVGLIPEPRRSPGEGNGNPLQYSWLGNPIDRGAWWATAHGITESDTNYQLNNNNKCALYCAIQGKFRPQGNYFLL